MYFFKLLSIFFFGQRTHLHRHISEQFCWSKYAATIMMKGRTDQTRNMRSLSISEKVCEMCRINCKQEIK